VHLLPHVGKDIPDVLKPYGLIEERREVVVHVIQQRDSIVGIVWHRFYLPSMKLKVIILWNAYNTQWHMI
jgi:hypothetical protein